MSALRLRSLASLLLLALACGGQARRFDHPLPTVSRVEILGWLEEHDWDRLESTAEELAAATADEPARELDLDLYYRSFFVSTARVGDDLRAWLAARPDSATAHLANARHLQALGWHLRGSRWARETDRKQIEWMRSAHAQAEHEARRALALDPARIEAYAVRMNLAMAAGRGEECRALGHDALELRPASFRIRETLFTCYEPRWGGSYDEMTRALRELRPQLGRQPRLACLEGWESADRSRLASSADRPVEALQLAERALRSGEHWRFHEARGDALRGLERWNEAILAYDRALDLLPEEPRLLVARARAEEGADDPVAARADLELARRVEPDDEHVVWLASLLARADQTAARRRELEDVDPKSIFDQARAAARAGRDDEAIQLLERLLDLEPGNFEACLELDRLLSRRQEWERILVRWNNYLELRPDDSRAWFERAGTQRHAGRAEEAAADLQQACGLGEQEACRILRWESGGG